MDTHEVSDMEKAYTQFIALVRIGRYHRDKESTQAKTVYEVASQKGFTELLATPPDIVQDMIDNTAQWKEEYPKALSNVLTMELGYDPFK